MKPMVLLVDDEANVLSALAREMRPYREQWDVVFATDGAAALESVRLAAFDLIVSDVLMPGMDGLELLQTLQAAERTRDIPVVLLTGSGERELKRRALELGATDLLNKPLDPEDLVARIRSGLRLKAYHDRLAQQNETLEARVAQRTKELEMSHLDIVWRLAKLAEFHDADSGEHVLRVGLYSHAVAQEMGRDAEFLRNILLSSPLHDVGKIGVPDTILNKPGPLTEEERAIVKRHCAVGAELLRSDLRGVPLFDAWQRMGQEREQELLDNPFLHMAATIAMTHHEHWDGTGYPLGLAGEEIPLESRIAGLADVFDALDAARPYKPSYSEETVMEILAAEQGRQFDPEVLGAFHRALPRLAAWREYAPQHTLESWMEAAK